MKFDERYLFDDEPHIHVHIDGFVLFAFLDAGAMMSVDENLMCSFQILKPADKRRFVYDPHNSSRPVTPPRAVTKKNKK